MTLEKLTQGKQVIIGIDNVWGDGGKGTIIDFLADIWADIIVRGTGGNNAGHTTVVDGEKRVFHLVPAGIAQDKYGKVNVLGNGMVIDLSVLCKELDELDAGGMTYNHLMISEDAHVTLPYHIALDGKTTGSQKKGGVGSTKRGIGPAYGDKICSRAGIQVRDLFDPDILTRRFEKLREFHSNIDIQEEVARAYFEKYAERIKPFVRNTIAEVHRFYKEGKMILGEGAQGLLLSSEFGTYPYVTASDCSKNGTATGMGLDAGLVDLCLGIVTFPIMHRVGAGPFPTEILGRASELYCAENNENGSPSHSVIEELQRYDIPFKMVDGDVKYDTHHPNIVGLLNSTNPQELDMGLRLASQNYGATTGRPRRMGWTDLPIVKYGVMINGPELVLTKPNCIRGAESYKMGVGYECGEEFSRGETQLRSVKPIYQSFKGFDEDITGMTSINELPSGLREGIDVLEKVSGGKVRLISNGPDRNQNIIP